MTFRIAMSGTRAAALTTDHRGWRLVDEGRHSFGGVERGSDDALGRVGLCAQPRSPSAACSDSRTRIVSLTPPALASQWFPGVRVPVRGQDWVGQRVDQPEV